jgi:hypothetical protein
MVFACEESFHLAGGLCLEAWQNVRVNIESEPDLGVSEHVGNHLRMDALNQHEGGGAVSQIVIAGVLKPSLHQQAVEVDTRRARVKETANYTDSGILFKNDRVTTTFRSRSARYWRRCRPQ